MKKIKLTDVDNVLKNNTKAIIAFVDENAILSISTLRILREANKSNIYYLNVEEEREVISSYSLRIIPTIHVYQNGNLVNKINLPYTKEDLECLVH